jgi:hypothetical protein
LLRLLDRLVDAGKSVIVIEHHLAVMAHADWIIDLGPGAGHDGGRIVFEGTPAELVAARSTLTGKHLEGFVGGPPQRVPSGPVGRGALPTLAHWTATKKVGWLLSDVRQRMGMPRIHALKRLEHGYAHSRALPNSWLFLDCFLPRP